MIIHGKEYTEVKDRLKVFWAKMSDEEKKVYQGLAVVTEMLWKNEDLSALLFRATILVNGQVAATGHAYEERVGEDQKQVNFTSWVENCETSAIGRALANMNIVGSEARPSAEEMQKVDRMASSATLVAGPKKFLKLPTTNTKPTSFIEEASKVRDAIKTLVGHDRPVVMILDQHGAKTLEDVKSRSTQEEVFKQMRDFLGLWSAEVEKETGKVGATFRDLPEDKRIAIQKKMDLLLV